MAGIVVWVADRLHEIVGLSDRQVAEYLTELARRSNNFEELKRKLESSGAIEMTSAVESFVFELWAKFPREKATRERVAKDVKKVPYKLLLEEEPEFGADSVGKDTKRSQNIRPQKGMVWESDDEDIQPPSGDESGSDSDEWERVEQERKKDLAERDAFSARIRLKDKDKTSHFVEKSDKKAFEEVKKRHQLEVKDKKKLVHELRKESRRDYLGKRRVEKVVELKDDVADEEFVFSDSKLTRVEKDHYEHKRKILTLTSEREKAAELEHIQRYFMPTENVVRSTLPLYYSWKVLTILELLNISAYTEATPTRQVHVLTTLEGRKSGLVFKLLLTGILLLRLAKSAEACQSELLLTLPAQ
jgi:pre-mRNA-splicing factor ATP-dependent RNA helicase DHX16